MIAVQTYTDIANALVNQLQLVSGIGVVHNRPRWINQWDMFVQNLVPAGDDKINGWWVSRESVEQDAHTIGVQGIDTRRHTFIITGFYSHLEDQNSELTFQQLIDDIMDALAPKKELISDLAFIFDPVRARLITTLFIANHYVHFTEIEAIVTTRVQRL